MNQKQNPKFDENEQTLKDKRKIKPLVLFLFLLGFAFLLLICWLFWILSGEALGFVIFALLTNIFYFFGGYYSFINELTNKKETKRSPNCIIWELKRKKSFLALYSYTAYFCLFCAFLYILLRYFTRFEGLKDLIAFLALTFFVCHIATRFYYSLNLKTMYITKNNLFIKKYLGKDIILPLGGFIIFHRTPLHISFMLIGDYSIESISNHSLFPIYFFLDGNDANIDEIQPLLKPYIINYLLKCDEKAYIKFKTFYQGVDIKYQYNIDYNEIDKLRKEQNNE